MSLINEFSIQLYSVGSETAKDFALTLEKIAKIGYAGVEFAGYGGFSAKEMKAMLDANGLKSVGTHVGPDILDNKLAEEIEYHKVLGTEYIILPWYEMKNTAEAVACAEKYNAAAAQIAQAGMKFGYHNHAHELVMDNGEYLMDSFMKAADPKNVCLELDMFWVAHAGLDPIAYMKRHAGRLEMLHIKQILDNESKKCVDIEDGMLDYKAIITEAKAMGVKHFVLEQEEFDIDPYISLYKNFKHIMSL